MAILALGFIALWLLVVAGFRAYLLARATGEVGIRFRDRPGSAQWWSRLVSTVGFVAMIAASITELAGMAPISLLDRVPLRLAGAVLVLVGIAATVAAQVAMRSSWRGDVDPEARTALVTSGPFGWVRNPIFTTSLLTEVGLGLMVPNVFAVLMLVAFVIAYEIQVRLVEEPYLQRVHGDAYQKYAERTGRFLPWIGRAKRD